MSRSFVIEEKTVLVGALGAIANKRRTRPQLERARLVFAQLAPWRTSQNTLFFKDVAECLDQAEEAMDYIEGTDTAYEKQEWRDEADMAWEGFAYEVKLLAEALDHKHEETA